jgi:beta-glucosidase/6-phospho-beta-glucosidase/beta-galactosidase
MPRDQAIHDADRVAYFKGTTKALWEAVKLDGVEVKAYFPWSKWFTLCLCLVVTMREVFLYIDGIIYRFLGQF